MAAKRAPSAYFIFCDEFRASAKEELVAAAPDGKVSVAAVAKALGERWKQLSDEEKQKYKDKHAQQAEALAQQAAARKGDEQAGGQAPGEAEEKEEKQQLPFGLPLGSVKRIMQLDDEVVRTSLDATRAVAKATELFLQAMGVKAAGIAKRSKRRTIKFEDLEQLSKTDRRLVDMGLKDIYQTEQLFVKLREGAQEKAAAQAGKRMQVKEANGKENEPVAKVRPITDFFKR